MTNLLETGVLPEDEESVQTDQTETTVPSDIFTPVIEVASWFVLLVPYKPKTMYRGQIALADTTMEAQRVFQSVGKVIGIGPLAFKALTNSRLNMADQRIPKVGEYWGYPRHSGQPYQLKERYPDGCVAYQLAMKDTELLGFCPDPDRIVSWVET